MCDENREVHFVDHEKVGILRKTHIKTAPKGLMKLGSTSSTEQFINSWW